MPTYTQADRPLAITTPLGKDVLLLTGLRGHEAISRLFSLQVDLLVEGQREIRFDRILGQNVTVEMRLVDGEKRYFNGLVKRFSQGRRDEHFLYFQAEIVPKFWLLTKKVRSRIFQHLSVPDILRKVLSGLDVTYELSGTYYERDYCVQYRESDFDFSSRLMEEEGIYYFFKHADGSHQLVVTDTASPSVPGQTNVIYDEVSGNVVPDMRITAWEKTQELRSGEYTLWDHCFELPGKHLEASQKTIDSVTAGKVTHKLNVGGNDQLEIYDYPGGYAQRFDGIDRAGAPRPQDLKRIYEDRDRTVKVRMEQEAVAALEIRGASDCGQFAAGHKFTLQRHFDANGPYILTGIEHDAHLSGYRSGEPPEFRYENHFSCIPGALRYRPQRVTPKPAIAGIQTATVVGPEGEEIFCDKYGRVKVQFHWDREGKKDANSSCWLRVAQVWAGKGWGAFFWPRIGHEVVVTFEEGDADQPLIIGSVYNAENMPWFGLPANKQLGGLKSASVHGTEQKNYNAIVFNDMKGHEHLSIHSERNLSLNSEYDKMIHAGRHKGEHVSVANLLTVGNVIPGGGSGGNGSTDSYGKGFDKSDPVPEPPPLGILGLNSVMVYGQNMQAATGLNHQLAVGNNIQICVNPIGLAAGVAAAPAAQLLAGVLGSGLGGNMQLTLGTNAQVTFGQAFEINIGPPKVQVDARFAGGDDHANPDGTAVKDPTHIVSTIFAGLLGVAAIIWVGVYAAETEDHTRATLTIVFQALIDVLLAGVMIAEMYTKKAVQDTEKKTWSLAYQIEPVEQQAGEFDWTLLDFTTAIGAAAAILAPLLAVSGENQPDTQPQGG